MVKGTRAQKGIQKDWVKRHRGTRISVSKNFAKMAVGSTISLSQFGPTFGFGRDAACPLTGRPTREYLGEPCASSVLVVMALAIAGLIVMGEIYARYARPLLASLCAQP